ncbi:MAG: O-antigen ligase family protein [Pseudomonadota bacterium]
MKNFPKSDGVDKDVGSGNKFSVFNGLMGAFLLFNLVIRFCTIFYYPPYNAHIAGFFGVIVSCCIFVILFPKYLRAFLFIFGFSFFLFGFGAIDIQSRVFELIVTCVATTLFVINWRAGKDGGQMRRAQSAEQGATNNTNGHELREKRKDTPVEHPLYHLPELQGGLKEPGSTPIRSAGPTGQAGQGGRLNRPLVVLVLCYVALSLFSLLLLPVRQIAKDLWFFGFQDFFFYLSIGPIYGFYYPVAAVVRVILFVVLAVQLSTSAFSAHSYKSLFAGIFSSAVFCAFIGLLDFYGIVPLAWYRFGITTSPGVLHSTFGNRGWFAEFILTAVPFVLIGFMSKIKGLWWKVFLFGCLVICEIALILAGGRSGWVSYPFILFICWLFFWFSKEGRLEFFHFRWKDLVKITVSVPITIIISLVIVFYVFIPLSDHLKNSGRGKGIQQGGGATKAYIVNQTMRLVEPSGRLKAWAQGVDVGRESPGLGLGYESFAWHANILSATQNSYYTIYKNNKHPDVLQTPHNIFVQIFVSGGAVGLCLWLLMAGYVVVILTFDLIRNKRLLNTPVIISIISFHIFGIFQSMQYIPMIWLLIFLSLGYAMTIDDGVLPRRLRRVFSVLTKMSVVLVAIGFFVYLGNFESKSLAEKYGLRIYAMDQDRDRFAGFFQDSQRWKYGDYRWSGKRGAISIADCGVRNAELGKGKDSGQIRRLRRLRELGEKKKDGRQGGVEIEFHCRTPGVEEEPVVLTVFHDGKPIDTISFTKKGSVRKKYELQETPGEEKGQRLVLEVSRTWIPHEHLGNFDRRELGVGVKIGSSERKAESDKR